MKSQIANSLSGSQIGVGAQNGQSLFWTRGGSTDGQGGIIVSGQKDCERNQATDETSFRGMNGTYYLHQLYTNTYVDPSVRKSGTGTASSSSSQPWLGAI